MKKDTAAKEEKRRTGWLSSLRHQITLVFIAGLLLTIVLTTLANSLFLGNYYVTRKTRVLLEAKETLKNVRLTSEEEEEVDDEEEEEEDDRRGDQQYGGFWYGEHIRLSGNSSFLSDGSYDEIMRISSRNNLSWVVLDAENSRYCVWGDNEEILPEKLFGYAFGLDLDNTQGDVLKRQDDCVIQKVHDRYVGLDYVECWGQYTEGNYFLIRSPLESIEESASISNRFYFFVGILVMLLSGGLVMLFLQRRLRPIDELTRLSRKMADLEFDEKYTYHAGNEIDVLGESFNRMSSQLEKTISELKSANLELQKDIENKIRIDEQRKEFLDNVSHELKTPIALIQGYAEGLKENITEDPESMDFYCDVIMDEADKMNKLVKSLLTLNQLESGKDPVVMEHFDLTALINGVLQKMDIMIRQNDAVVLFRQTSPVYVWADEFKIEEVVTNYTSNALHHLGGDRQVEIRIEKNEGRAKVSVFNTGQPIPEADLPNLWEKFYKVDKARTREYGGSGIGLSIVKAIMESHGQAYGVKNYENGVEFWFTLDLQ